MRSRAIRLGRGAAISDLEGAQAALRENSTRSRDAETAIRSAPVGQIRPHRLGPPSLLTCMPEPKAREVCKTQHDFPMLLVKMAEAGEDCRVKLESVKMLLTQ